MVYEFVSKIKNVENVDALNNETLGKIVSEINARYDKPLDLKFVLPDAENTGEFLVKSQASVTSLPPPMHDTELEEAVDAFISYLKDIANAIQGEVSERDGFYNNSKTFKRLFS
jgi:hypothetical protein